MNITDSIAAAALVWPGVRPVSAQPARTDVTPEGLVRSRRSKVDKAWLLPGADFRPYKKVLLKNAEVAFQKNWLRNVNDTGTPRLSSAGRVTDADALKIVDAARTGFDKVWARGLQVRGATRWSPRRATTSSRSRRAWWTST